MGGAALAEVVPIGGRSGVGLFTVVVCTAGRRSTLDDLLDDLAALEDPCYEVVLVENARHPRLDAARLAARGVRHVVERRIGLDVARNRGLVEAAGELVAYVDDDCRVDRGWLAGLRRGFADPRVGLVTGRVLPATLERMSEQAFELAFPWDRGTFPLRFHRDEPGELARGSMHPLGTGCNMAFRRRALLGVGGFDEGLDMGTLVGGGGDMDAFARVVDAGVVAAYEPSALVRHRHRGTMADLHWQVWGYGLAQGATMVKGVLTRRGARWAVLSFWSTRLGQKLGDVRRQLRHRGPLPRTVLALEAAGMLVGPVAYPLSKVHAWVRRLRS